MAQDYKYNDFYLQRDSNGVFDLVIEDGTFKPVYSFDTAILMAIYADRRADSSEVPNPLHRRGWLGNSLLYSDGFENGCKLWVLAQARRTSDILSKAVAILNNSLAWLVLDKHLKSINVRGEFVGTDGIRLYIDFVTLDNKTESRYYDMWSNTLPRVDTDKIVTTTYDEYLTLENGDYLVSDDGSYILV